MNVFNAHAKVLQPDAAPTSREIPAFDHADFAALLRRDPAVLLTHPCVVRGFTENWEASRLWKDIDRLNQEFGSLPVTAGAPQFTTNVNSEMCQVSTDFGTYLEYMKRPERVAELFDGKWTKGGLEIYHRLGIPLYCGNIRIVRHSREPVFSMIDPVIPGQFECLNNEIPYYYQTGNHLWLYVSIRGALTPLHQDNNNVIAYLAQIKGRKDAILYSPVDKSYYYKKGVGYMDPLAPDEANFPEWRSARAWKTTLNEGELLIWGPDWAHHVRTIEDSVTVSFDIVNWTNLAGFTKAQDWRDELGHFARKNDALIRTRMPDQEIGTLLDSGTNAALGRKVMICVLRAALQSSIRAEQDRVKQAMLEILEGEDGR